jgi:hypothetical protein
MTAEGDGSRDRCADRLRSTGLRRRPDRHPGCRSREGVDGCAAEFCARAATTWSDGCSERCAVPVRDVNGTVVLETDGLVGRGTTVESPTGALSFADAQERLLSAMAATTVRCAGERVFGSAGDATIGSITGIGFPPRYGGGLRCVDQYTGGAAGFVAPADELAAAYGERRFGPPTLLLERAVPAGRLRAAVGA